jgi:hypothetical protein
MNSTKVGQTTGSVFTYMQTSTLVVGNFYGFQVSAVNAIGEGTKSGSLSVIAAQVPSTPNSPTKLSASASQITVQWTEPGDGGSPILGYRVYKDNVHIVGTFDTSASVL